MKRCLIFIVIMGFGTIGLFTVAAQPRLKIDPEQSSEQYISSLRSDQELVEVLGRSITFGSVLELGERILSVEYPNVTLLCLDTAYYAGKAQGLIWAMDRDTVMEHRLEWIIDDAHDLFLTCATIPLQEALDDENTNDKDQLEEEVKKILYGQVQLIQEKLRYARDVKVIADDRPLCVWSTRVPRAASHPARSK